MYPAVRAALFRLDPERVHGATLRALQLASATWPGQRALRALFDLEDPRLAVEAFGLRFRNCIGLAAGYDKEGAAIRGLACLGFGHIEVGTVTPQAQPGNPRPRLFRLPKEQAVINRMGFPNCGGHALLRRLRRLPGKRDFILGVNIGKGRDTPLEQAAADYAYLLRLLHAHADYLAINISSPNTLGLRRLQSRAYLDALLGALASERRQLADSRPRPLPLLVKIAPDLGWDELEEVLASLRANGMDGVIATNTTLSRSGVQSALAREGGGLSGAPLRSRALEVVRFIHEQTHGELTIIGEGGILCADDALRLLDAGATLVQVYTGLVYGGPALARQVLATLRARTDRAGRRSEA